MSQNNKPRNVMIFTTDEHVGSLMACAGDPLVRTPNLDRLASRGVMFKRAYCNNPICVPGRYSIMTGQYVRDIGSLHYGDGLDPATWTYPKHFAAAGFQTTCVGKMHFMGLEQMHGWMFRPFGDMELVQGHAKMPGFVEDEYAEGNPAPVWLDEWVRRAGPGENGFIIFDKSVTREACINLRDYYRSDIFPLWTDGRPLLFQVSFKTPHWPFWAPKELYDYYRERVTLPTVRERSGHPFMKHKQGWEQPDGNTEEEILNARAAYYALIEWVDGQIGQVLDTMEELGVLDDFMIIYHSDHGEMDGEHDAWGKGCAYEDSVHVPLLVSCPGEIPAGEVRETPVSLVDLFPTMCDYAGLETPPDMRGDSLRPLIDGGDEAFAERIVISEFHGGYSPWVMAVRGDLKYVHYTRDDAPDELFDLSDDPHETENRIDRPEYADARRDLLAAIEALPEPFQWQEEAEQERMTPRPFRSSDDTLGSYETATNLEPLRSEKS